MSYNTVTETVKFILKGEGLMMVVLDGKYRVLKDNIIKLVKSNLENLQIPYTHILSTNEIKANGANVVFCDPKPENFLGRKPNVVYDEFDFIPHDLSQMIIAKGAKIISHTTPEGEKQKILTTKGK